MTSRPRISTSKAATNFFIVFVDGIFTTLLERLFTNVFEVSGAI